MRRSPKAFILLSCLLLLPVAGVLSQEAEDSRRGKIFLVPEGWLTLGTYTYVKAAPLLGYHITDRLAVGAGPQYTYSAKRSTTYNPDTWRTHVYGGKAFLRFALLTRAEQFLPIALFSDLYVQAEYEALSLEKAYFYAPSYPEEGRFMYHGLLIGPGITQGIGPYSSASLTVLWDLNESSRSPYSSPEFRVGFNIYF